MGSAAGGRLERFEPQRVGSALHGELERLVKAGCVKLQRLRDTAAAEPQRVLKTGRS
jgi:hypothetical protein